jgi:hypothetical protein
MAVRRATFLGLVRADLLEILTYIPKGAAV